VANNICFQYTVNTNFLKRLEMDTSAVEQHHFDAATAPGTEMMRLRVRPISFDLHIAKFQHFYILMRLQL
jgi:hypothetical protein